MIYPASALTNSALLDSSLLNSAPLNIIFSAK